MNESKNGKEVHANRGGRGAVVLSSGTSLTLSPDTGYVYCLSSISASSFSSFSVNWTQ